MSNTSTSEKKKKFSAPHIYLLLIVVIVFCTLLTWILPAGEFDRTVNEAGTEVVVPGTFHEVEQSPVGPFQMVQDLYVGMNDAAGVVFFVFISYASISIIISSGAFNGLVAFLLKILKGKARAAIIPIFITIIGIGSSTIGLYEEVFPFIPVFVGICIAMGYDAVVGLAIVALGAGLGYSGATINPFTVGLAQGIAGLPTMTGIGFRIFCHLCFIIVGSVLTIRYALKIQADPTKSVVYADGPSRFAMSEDDIHKHPFGIREKLVLVVLVIGIGVIVYGSRTYGWYFQELSAVFIIMGIISAIIMGLGPNAIAEKFADGFKDIAFACMAIGIARGILIVLQDGCIIDTVVYYASLPLANVPTWLSGVAMLIVQTIISFFIGSGSGQAATSMPIMAPLADLLGFSRETAVLAFQMSDGLTNSLWPTGMTAVMCSLAGIKMHKWWKWFVPVFICLFITEAVLMVIAVQTGFGL